MKNGEKKMIEEMFYNKTTLIDMDKIMRKDNFKQKTNLWRGKVWNNIGYIKR